MNNLFTHWKSTVSGILTVTLSTSAAFLAPPLNSYVSAKIVLWCSIFQVIGKIWISAITQDAGKTLATLPGSSIPVSVPAHEIPDNPAATPVKPEVKP